MRAIHHRNRSTADRARLAEYAASQRERAPESEARLWACVRARQLGVLFRRQVPIAGYIVDLVVPERRLLIEIDGAYHRRRRAADARRDAVLRRVGYRVLRLSTELMMRDLPEAVARIRAALEPAG